MKFSLKTMLGGLLGTVSVCGAVVLFALYQTNEASHELDAAQARRFQSNALADELRQSSDDLTRLARTYVVSGDAKWEQQYFEVLDIRNGKKARPAHYERIYWDFRAANETPSGTADAAKPLAEMMKASGFTQEEFAKLKEAQNNSDDLVRTETIAMNMVKGLYDDGKGNYTRQGEPDLAKARAMMHDLDYHRFKAKIMKPVDEFLTMLDTRTQAEVAAAQGRRSVWANVALIAGLLTTLIVAATVTVIRRKVMGFLNATRHVTRAITQGDLSQHIDTSGEDEGAELARELQAMQTQLRQMITEVRESSNGIAAGSSDISVGNEDLSRRTEAQASSLQQTAASMDQITASVRANSESAQQANQLAKEACSTARNGGAAMTDVVQTMDGIAQSSKRIADIIGVIDGIAFQTNILALNAAVESARAGEHGRGFAVVASEVRSLAHRSADAAKEIKSLISDSVSRADHGSQLVQDAGQRMADIVSQVERVSQLIGEISEATGEQSSGIAQVGHAVNQLDEMTQRNAALVEESAATAIDIKQQSDRLHSVVHAFKVEAAY